MMKKRNIVIICTVVLLGLAALAVVRSMSKSSTLEQDYHVEDIDAVTKLYLSNKFDVNLLLERVGYGDDDTLWLVNEQYAANQPLVDILLETLHEMRIRQHVNRTAVPNIIKNLSVSSIKVEVYQKVYLIDWFGGKLRLFPSEKLTRTYYVGNETQDNMGTYMFRDGDKEPYIVHIPGFRGFLTPRFNPNPPLWRTRKIVHCDVQDLKSVRVEIPQAQNESFEVVRNGESFDLRLLQTNTVAPQFDTARVAQLLSSFSNLNFDEYASVVPKVELDTTFSRPPGFVLTVTDMNDRVRSLRTYVKFTNPELIAEMEGRDLSEIFDVDRLYAILDNSDTVLIQYYVFDNILQPASYFLGKDINVAK
jgi:hypothetical protein